MASFVFVGDPVSEQPSNPNYIELMGHVFDLRGAPVRVTDEKVIAKLRGNNHFKEVTEASEAVANGNDHESAAGNEGAEAPGRRRGRRSADS